MSMAGPSIISFSGASGTTGMHRRAKTASTSAHFGGQTSMASPQAATEAVKKAVCFTRIWNGLGNVKKVWPITKTVANYMKKGTNGELLKGLAMAYGAPLAFGAEVFLGPIGWIASPFMLPVSMYFTKQGEGILEKLDKTQGPLSKFFGKDGLKKTWDTLTSQNFETQYPQLFRKYNALVNGLIREAETSDKEMASLFKKIKLDSEVGWGQRVKNVIRVITAYSDKWYGKWLNAFTNFGRKMPIFRPLVFGIGLLFHGAFIAIHYSGVTKAAARQAAKQAAHIVA